MRSIDALLDRMPHATRRAQLPRRSERSTGRHTRKACAETGLAGWFLVVGSGQSHTMAAGESLAEQQAVDTQTLTQELITRGFQFARLELLEVSLIAISAFAIGIAIGWLLLRPGRSGFSVLLAMIASALFCFAGNSLLLGHRPSPLESFPWLWGCLFGTLFVAAILARNRRVLKAWSVALCMLITSCAAAIGLFYFATDASAAQFDFSVPTAREKQELVDRLKSTQLLSRDPSKPRDVHLKEVDLNILLGWKASLDGTRIRSKVYLSDDRFLLIASIPGQLPGISRRFINANTTGRVLVDDGHVELAIDEIRVGGTILPSRMRNRLQTALTEAFQESTELQPLLAAIESLRIHSGNVEIVASSGTVRNDITDAMLHRRLFSPELKYATVEQVEHLLARARVAPGRPTFEELMSAAFEKAYADSKEIGARDANKAALLALGIVVADAQLARLVDYSLSPDAKNVIKRNVRRVRLRGRFDLAQHFCASGALTITAGKEVSDLVGRVKEEIDAGIPGKGFSFVDILADRAGTRFARVCIESPERAAEFQDKLRRGVDIEEFFPPIDGLPERIKESDLAAGYGGVGGTEYRRLLSEIEKRLDQLPLLRPR